MPRALARAWEDEQNEKLFFRYLLQLSSRFPFCSFVCARLPSRIKIKAKERLPAVCSCNCSHICIHTNFPVCIPYYLAESQTSKEGAIVVGVVVGLLGVVAVLLVAALVAVIQKHRNKSDVTGAVTLPLVRDNVPGPG